VLLDGQRSVGSALSVRFDITPFPQQLIKRVEWSRCAPLYTVPTQYPAL